MKMKDARFYFDFVSSNVYLAWTQLAQLSRDHDLHITPVPVLFAGLLNGHDNVGPAEIPAKRYWMLKNTLRKAAILDVPLNPPIHHPFNPLLALRACCTDMSDGDLHHLVSTLLNAVWVDGLHISDPDVVARLANDIGLDGTALVQAAGEESAKNRLKDNTNTAVGNGIFGIPSITIGSELFFGFDDFPHLEQYLAGNDPIDQSILTRWLPDTMTASSTRSRKTGVST